MMLEDVSLYFYAKGDEEFTTELAEEVSEDLLQDESDEDLALVEEVIPILYSG